MTSKSLLSLVASVSSLAFCANALALPPPAPPSINDVLILVDDFEVQTRNVQEAVDTQDGTTRLLEGTPPFTIEAVTNLTTGAVMDVIPDVCVTLPFAGDGPETVEITVSNLAGMATGTFRIDQGAAFPAPQCSSTGAPPIVNAGAGQDPVFALESAQPQEASVALDGTMSDDDNLPFASITWSEGATVLATGDLSPTVSLPVGFHTITLTVTDRDEGSTAVDNTFVNVLLDTIPRADAGDNQNPVDADADGSEQFTLDGSGSSDDMGIATYLWRDDQGVVLNEGMEASRTLTLTRTVAGSPYVFTLEVIDTAGQSSTDTVQVEVTTAAVNLPPNADAGADQTVIDADEDGTESFTLDGSGSSDDGNAIMGYVWLDDAGAQVNVGGEANPAVTLTRPVSATPYVFTLQIADTAEFVDSDTVQVFVRAPSAQTQAPVADAGPDQRLTDEDGDGVELVSLDGSASTDDGVIQTFTWTLGANQIATGQTAQAALPVGTNIVTLTVTDDAGVSDSDTVTIIIDGGLGGRTLQSLTGLNPNQRSMATTVDSICPRLASMQDSLTSNEQDLLTRCSRIISDTTTDGEARAGLQMMSGEEISAQQTTATKYAGLQQGNLAARVSAVRGGVAGINVAGLNLKVGDQTIPGAVLASGLDAVLGGNAGEGSAFEKLGIFVNGSIQFGDKDVTGNEAGFDFDTIGITAGADYRFSNQFFLGAALGYNDGDVDFDNDGGGLDSTGLSGSVFGSYYASDRFYIDGILTFGSIDYDSKRNISYTELNNPNQLVERTAEGDTDGDQISGGIAAGMDFQKEAWTLTPKASLYYLHVDIDGFSETGAQGLNLAYSDQSAQSFTATLGGSVSYASSQKWGVAVPYARLDFVREFEDDSEVINVVFVNDPFVNDPNNPSPGITILTDAPDRDYLLIGLGVSLNFANGFSGFLDYETVQAYDDLTSNKITLGFRRDFQ